MANSNALRAGAAFVEFTLKDGKIRKGLASLEKRFNAVGKRLQGIGKIGLAAGASIGAPIAAALVTFSKAGSDLADMAARTGLSVEALGELGFAAAQSGASMEAVEKGARAMAKMLYAAEGGAAGANETLAALGLKLEDLRGLSPEEQFTLIAEGLEKIEEPGKRSAVAMKALGKSGADLLPMVAGLRDARDQARALGLVMSTEDANAADAFGDALDVLWSQLARVMQTVGAAVAGPITDFLTLTQTVIANVIEWAGAHRGLIQAVAAGAAIVAALGAALVAIGGAFSLLGLAAAGLSAAIGVAGAVIGAILSPIGLVVAAIAGAVVAFATLTETGREMTAQLSAWFGELGAIATTTFGAISNALASGDIGLAAEILWAGLKLAWLQGTQALRETWFNMTAGIAKVWYTVWAGMQVLASSVWGNLSRGWSYTAEFFATAWETAVGNIKKAWNTTVAFIERTWQRIKGLFGADVSAELDRINAELTAANTEIDRQNGASAADRAAAAAAAREQSRKDQAGTLDAIGADLAAKTRGADDGAAAKIAAAEKALADARGALNNKAAAAAAAAAAAEEEQKKKKKKAEPAAAGMSDAAGKLSSMGTFSAAVAALSFGGGGVDNEILKVNREQLAEQKAANRKKLELPKAT